MDAVVANAGLGHHAPLPAITEWQFDRTFDTNVKGVLFTIQKALPLLADGATVVIIGYTGSTQARVGISLYRASKAATAQAARGWIQDIKGSGVRINVTSPGAVNTESLRSTLDQALGADGVAGAIKAMGKDKPTGRIAEPHEIARAVMFLSGDESGFITGMELFVDGGPTVL
ncbi:SDR family oxidoreductase [Embleya sp. NPDC059259]|uniref:SDR family oxidoreductase n=1 Tax=unclassified Embleya TaxID=2699296 RepID=UPI0036C9BD72